MQRSIFTPTVQLLHTIHKPQKRPKHSLIFSQLFDEGTAVESPLYIRNNRFSGSRKSCAKDALVQERYKVVEPVSGFSRKCGVVDRFRYLALPFSFPAFFRLFAISLFARYFRSSALTESPYRPSQGESSRGFQCAKRKNGFAQISSKQI